MPQGQYVDNRRCGPGSESSAKSWIAVLAQLAPLKPAHIISDHGELGDGSLTALQRSFLVDAETETLAAKRAGESADEAAKSVGDALKAKYSDWGNANYIGDTVKEIYARDQGQGRRENVSLFLQKQRLAAGTGPDKAFPFGRDYNCCALQEFDPASR